MPCPALRRRQRGRIVAEPDVGTHAGVEDGGGATFAEIGELAGAGDVPRGRGAGRGQHVAGGKTPTGEHVGIDPGAVGRRRRAAQRTDGQRHDHHKRRFHGGSG